MALGNRARRSCLALAGASPGSATHRGDAGDGGWLTLAAGLRGAGGWTAGACCPALPGAPQSCTPCACRPPAPAIWGCQAGGPPSTSQPPQGAAWPVGCFGGTVSLCCMSLGCLSFAKGHRLPVTRCGGGGGLCRSSPPSPALPPISMLGAGSVAFLPQDTGVPGSFGTALRRLGRAGEACVRMAAALGTA